MGYDAKHRVVAGYIVREDDAYYRAAAPSCRHALAPGARFCAECGAPANQSKTYCRLERSRFKEFTVAEAGIEGPCDFVVGWAGEAEDCNDAGISSMLLADVQKLIALRDKLRAALQEAGITVDESTFGVHSVVHYS